mmetsp:Transcript_108505/g.305825  ORF Transcript_108505/g.305825 Transcript_108505/m.305825 type:complete len:377 (-) Transcript_108505:143-1273(-)
MQVFFAFAWFAPALLEVGAMHNPRRKARVDVGGVSPASPIMAFHNFTTAPHWLPASSAAEPLSLDAAWRAASAVRQQTPKAWTSLRPLHHGPAAPLEATSTRGVLLSIGSAGRINSTSSTPERRPHSAGDFDAEGFVRAVHLLAACGFIVFASVLCGRFPDMARQPLWLTASAFFSCGMVHVLLGAGPPGYLEAFGYTALAHYYVTDLVLNPLLVSLAGYLAGEFTDVLSRAVLSAACVAAVLSASAECSTWVRLRLLGFSAFSLSCVAWRLGNLIETARALHAANAMRVRLGIDMLRCVWFVQHLSQAFFLLCELPAAKTQLHVFGAIHLGLQVGCGHILTRSALALRNAAGIPSPAGQAVRGEPCVEPEPILFQ